MRPGGYLLYDSSWPLDRALVRDGITILGIPFGQMCVETFAGRSQAHAAAQHRLRRRARGAARHRHGRRRRDAAREVREEALAARRELPRASSSATTTRRRTTTVRCPSVSSGWTRRSDHILIDGNTAAALGAVYAGATVGAWYPITPSTSLMEAFKEFCKRFRIDPETEAQQLLHHPGGGRAGGGRAW